jgi:hypothetical protein
LLFCSSHVSVDFKRIVWYFKGTQFMVVSASGPKRRLTAVDSMSDAVETSTSRKPDMEKNKALDAAMAQIERAFGKGSIMRMGAKGTGEAIEVISSGSLGLDLALGIGGLPRGPGDRDLRAGEFR